MLQTKIKIMANKKIAPEYYKMTFESSEMVRLAMPGQFVHIRVSDNSEPLLRRPFSIHSIKDTGDFEILYRVVGKGTALLAGKKAGEKLDVLGPLGNGFKINEAGQESLVLIGGGAGIAPLFFLAQETHYSNNIVVLIGGKTKNQILCEDEFKELDVEVMIATEDGSYGHKGLVTDFLKVLPHASFFQQLDLSIFACGPLLMEKEISEFSMKHNLPCQVSLEAVMACGVGACLGCAVQVKGESPAYRKVCVEGPVFEAKEIVWEVAPLAE